MKKGIVYKDIKTKKPLTKEKEKEFVKKHETEKAGFSIQTTERRSKLLLDQIGKRVKARDHVSKLEYKSISQDKKMIDFETPLAEEEETSILSRQRYYVYIMWFIITAIVLYITVSNLINPDSSFTSLLLSIILLIGILVVLFYNTFGTYVNRIESDVQSINFSGISYILKILILSQFLLDSSYFNISFLKVFPKSFE